MFINEPNPMSPQYQLVRVYICEVTGMLQQQVSAYEP